MDVQDSALNVENPNPSPADVSGATVFDDIAKAVVAVDNNWDTKASVAVNQVRNGVVKVFLLQMQEFNPAKKQTVPAKL